MKQRISYTLRLIKAIDDSGSAIEVENYLVNKSTKHVFAVGKKLKQGWMHTRKQSTISSNI